MLGQRRGSPRGAAAAVLALVLAAGCGPSEERTSDRQVYEAIERLRNDTAASNEERRLRLAALRQIPAQTGVASEAQDACANAYLKLLDSEDAISMAELQMKAASALQPAPSTAIAEVARAEQLLDRAKAAMPACDAAAAKLAIRAR